jgi:hypothetical protein
MGNREGERMNDGSSECWLERTDPLQLAIIPLGPLLSLYVYMYEIEGCQIHLLTYYDYMHDRWNVVSRRYIHLARLNLCRELK